MFSFTKFNAVVIAIVSLSATTVHSQTLPANCSRTYTIKSGDICNKISASQGVSTYQLATVNAGIINPTCSNLFAGEIICLAITGQDCTPVHVVVPGDGCTGIATVAGITFGDLLANNPNVDAGCSNIYPDEVLCVAPAANSTTPA